MAALMVAVLELTMAGSMDARNIGYGRSSGKCVKNGDTTVIEW